MKWKIYGISAAVLLFLLFLITPAGIVNAEENESGEAVCYTALGDSIPNGYCADDEAELVSYPSLIAQDIQEASEKKVELSSFAKNGLTTSRLNQNILTAEETIESIKKADLITITIGSNDLMHQFKKVCQEILNNDTKFQTTDEALEALQKGIADNPLLLVKVIGAIGGWDYASFESEWKTMMDTISSLRKSDSQVIVTTIYNPVSKRELPGTMNSVVEDIISKMNQIIKDNSDEYNYKAVDLLYSGIEENTQSDGLHPNQKGQNLICFLVEDELNMELAAGPLPDKAKEAKEAKEAAQKSKLEKQKKIEEQKLKRQQTAGLIILCLNIVVIWIVIYLYRKKKNRLLSRKKK